MELLQALPLGIRPPRRLGPPGEQRRYEEELGHAGRGDRAADEVDAGVPVNGVRPLCAAFTSSSYFERVKLAFRVYIYRRIENRK